MPGTSDRFRPIGSVTDTGQGTTPAVLFIPDNVREVGIVTTARSLVRMGVDYTAPAVSSTNGVTTIESHGTPTGGTFTLTAFPGTKKAETTSALTYDESAADVETAILALDAFASGDTTDAGGALPTAITITWGGVYAGTVPPFLVTSSVTGGANSVVKIRTSTVPDQNGGYGYVEASTPTVYTRSMDGHALIDRYLYIASVSSTTDYFITFYG